MEKKNPIPSIPPSLVYHMTPRMDSLESSGTQASFRIQGWTISGLSSACCQAAAVCPPPQKTHLSTLFLCPSHAHMGYHFDY